MSAETYGTATYTGGPTNKKQVLYMVRVPLVRAQAVKDLARECRAEHIETEEYELHKDVTFGFDSLDACKIFRNRYDQLMRNFPPDVLNQREAIFGLVAWIQDRPLNEAAAREFCDINSLPEPRHGWQSNLRLS